MAAKRKTESRGQKTVSQSVLFDALTDAGYEFDGYENKPGNHLIVRLTPVDLIENGEHLAITILKEHGLQARCNVFAASPHDLLIVTVQMPGASNPPIHPSNNPTERSS